MNVLSQLSLIVGALSVLLSCKAKALPRISTEMSIGVDAQPAAPTSQGQLVLGPKKIADENSTKRGKKSRFRELCKLRSNFRHAPDLIGIDTDLKLPFSHCLSAQFIFDYFLIIVG